MPYVPLEFEPAVRPGLSQLKTSLVESLNEPHLECSSSHSRSGGDYLVYTCFPLVFAVQPACLPRVECTEHVYAVNAYESDDTSAS